MKVPAMPRSYFTLEQVNAVVPQLNEIMSRAVQLHSHLTRTVRALGAKGLRVDHDVLGGKKTVQPPAGTEAQLAEATALYDAIVHEAADIEALGGEVKGVDQGLVDFWSFLDGETEVLLCWKLGERRVAFYHLPEAGYAGRQPVEGHLFGERRELALRP
jgi:hypothetical protein